MIIIDAAGLFTTGRVLCWGKNAAGQLGRDNVANVGSAGTMNTLDCIVFSDSQLALEISAFNAHVCALFANGRVRCWGNNSAEQLGDGSTVNKGSGPYQASISNAVYVSFATTVDVYAVVSVTVGRYWEEKIFHT
jgi:alpha-tubulin suppressor-like RCC1 family protein